MRIITSYINPPIPCRSSDWCAYVDGREEIGPYGYGETEKQAIDALKVNLADLDEPPFPFNLSALELIAAIEGSGYELFMDLANKPAIAPRY